MGDIRTVHRVKLVCGMLAGSEAVLGEARRALVDLYGRVELESDTIPFNTTAYYRDEMGPGLRRRFLAFEETVDPGCLAAVKRRTNRLEQAFAVRRDARLCRRVNLDPGYVAPSKLVLASTKDFAHRVYLGRGIYAEVTLNFGKNGCRPLDWTYPDYRSEPYARFLLAVRETLLGGERNRRSTTLRT